MTRAMRRGTALLALALLLPAGGSALAADPLVIELGTMPTDASAGGQTDQWRQDEWR